ncbi:polyamine ABC transporter ATP-binding protein [Arthrobacter pityocampae]|uniref:Polyamine ABC transporter ATP-binding protein n=1 Tax=Arthrobacter pityocampae TaxID=547334 RepID=A0A2S5IVP1_9MICC|nr:ABC transporter ATP-binding protein [Arthrobacter pityocampae]PPB48606.1 polyamine ABC transporter ATP-binding protein [Arthrobacter pityocampae]
MATSLSTTRETPRTASPAGSLQLTDLVKQYPGSAGTEPAVAGITLDIRPGEFLTLLGPSGCGKTTTLRMIAGFETPSHGTLTLDGEDMIALTPDKRPMAMVFQSYALFPHMSVFDNVAYGLRLQRFPRKRVQEEVDFALASMSLTKLADRAPNQLSGGQQQRVALARAMVMKPKVLLFDEPLSNLDAKLRVQMRTEIRALQHKLGITSVYVTHDQDEAMSLSDRIVVMRQGRIEQVATPDTVYRKPASVFVADFIGRANFLDTTIDTLVTDGGGNRATVRALGATYVVPAHDALVTGSPVCLMVRPESVALSPAPESREVTGSYGRVLKSVFYGAWVEYEIETVDGNVTAVIHDPAPGDILASGTFVQVSFEQDRAWLLPADD